MSNINDKLNYLDETKQLFKQALITKGQQISDEDTFRSYVDKLLNITGSSKFVDLGLSNSTYSTKNASYFIGQSLTILYNNFDKSKISNGDLIRAGVGLMEGMVANTIGIVTEIKDIDDDANSCNITYTVYASDIDTTRGDITSQDVAEGKIGFCNNTYIIGTKTSEVQFVETESEASVGYNSYSGVGSISVDTIHRTSCICNNRLFIVSDTNISIHDINEHTNKNYVISDLLGNTFSTRVLSIGYNNPNSIGNNFYYLCLSSNGYAYFILYDYTENKLFSINDSTVYNCKNVFGTSLAESSVGIISKFHNKLVSTYTIEFNANSSFGGAYIYTLDCINGTSSNIKIISADGFWACYPIWLKDDRVITFSTFYNNGQWNGEKYIFMFNDDLSSYKSVHLQSKDAGHSEGFVFNDDMTYCLTGADLYKVDYDPSAQTMSRTLLKSNALPDITGYTIDKLHYSSYGCQFSNDNQFLLLKINTTQLALLKLKDDYSFELINTYNLSTGYFLTPDIYSNDTYCISGSNTYVIKLSVESLSTKYLVYNNTNYYNYNENLLTINDSDVLSGVNYIGVDGIQSGSMPNNGTLTYTPREESQLIPSGYTNGGIINGVDITKLSEYNECLDVTKNILGIN